MTQRGRYTTTVIPRIAWLLHTFSRLVSVFLAGGVVNRQDFYRGSGGEEAWIPWACKDSIKNVEFQIECLDPEWEQCGILVDRGGWRNEPGSKDFRDQEYVNLMLKTCPKYGQTLQDLNTMPNLSLDYVQYVR